MVRVRGQGYLVGEHARLVGGVGQPLRVDPREVVARVGGRVLVHEEVAVLQPLAHAADAVLLEHA
eukprot:scaffold111341_cov42-Phaeocystis_antarctica.AAC.1